MKARISGCFWFSRMKNRFYVKKLCWIHPRNRPESSSLFQSGRHQQANHTQNRGKICNSVIYNKLCIRLCFIYWQKGGERETERERATDRETIPTDSWKWPRHVPNLAPQMLPKLSPLGGRKPCVTHPLYRQASQGNEPLSPIQLTQPPSYTSKY